MCTLIGVGGCSRSGKSSLALKIKDQLSDSRVLLLDMDDFVFSETHIPPIRDRVDWERPESVNFNQIVASIEENQDSYDVIIVEGILVFANQQLKDLFHTTIKIKISKETFIRRRKREVRWGEEPDWYLEHVWDSYLTFGQYPEADFILSGEKVISKENLDEIIDSL